MPLTQLKRLFRRSQPPPAAKIAPFIRPHINIGYGNDQLDGVDSLQELIEFNARHNPDHIFCTQLIKNSDKEGRGAFGLPHWITFAQLLNAVERAAAWLVKSGFTSGRTQRGEDIPPVAIYLSSDISIFIYIAALLRIGTPVLLLSARLASVALQHLIEETSPSCILVNSHLLERTASEAAEQSSTNGHLRHGKPVIARALGYENFINPQHPDISGAPIPPKYVYVGHEDANCIIFHSSGTTGLPKPVSHSHAYLLIIATCHRLQEYSGSKGSLCTLPLYHGYALLPTMLSMSLGMPLFLMPSSMIPTGRSTVDALNTCQPGLLFTVPSILEEMVSLPDEEGLQALKKLDIIPAGGAPMKENIGDYLRGHGIRYLNHWGCTELGPMTPIEVPDLNVDWRWLRPRTDHSLRLTSFDNSHTHFQISGQLPGWKSVFEAQDLLVVDPSNPLQYKLGGRQDNLILLSTGEKVLPAALENELSQHPDIKELCAFGEGQVALGVLVELKKAVNHETFLREIRPYLDRGNAFMDKHGKVHPDMIIVTSEDTKPLVRTDKNSLARKASVAAFNEEISSCYSQSSTASLYSELVTSLRSSDREARVESIREIVTSILEYDEIEGSSDIFEAGMDSYQANRLRRSLEHSLNSPSSPPSQRITLEKDFCFRHPTIDRLNEAIERLIDEQEPDDNNDPLDPIATMMTTLGKYRELMLESLMSTPVKAVPSLGPAFNQELQEASSATVLITGSTGSLGCYLLSRLTRLPNIAKVICLCRRHPGEDPVHRQRHLLAERGAKLDDEAWEKISLYEVDFNRDDFGVSEGVYEEFLQATHIIHNAWPVSFKRTLSSFEQQIRTTIGLICLAHRSASRRQSFLTTRLAFISSIAVAGHYTSGDVPEERLAPEHTLPLGYAEAKWVAEELLLAACKHYQTLGRTPTFNSSIMRVGQISGAEESGAWNELEQIPLIMRTSEKLGRLPALEGTLSWLPVNRTADSICDLLFSQQFSQFSHIENPSRQPWDELIRDLSEMLSGSDPILTIPFFEWLDIVRSLKEDDLITSIVPFLERDFSVIGCGEVVLSTKKSRAASATLAQSGPIGRVQLSTYVDTWRSSR